MSDQDPINKMYTIANGVSSGGLGIPITYCLEDKCFYLYQDGYWKCTNDIPLLSLITNKDKYKWANSFSITIRKQILDNLKLMVFKELSEFNSHELINFPSGMFDILGNNMISHDKKFLSTIRIPYKYNMIDDCPLWLETLHGIFEGDKERIEILQEFFGYSLTRDVRREKAMLLLGESRSGKSTILETLSSLVGEDNCSFVPLDSLQDGQATPMLINKVVNIDSDVCGNAEKFEKPFKVITSGEPIKVNDKFIKQFTFRPFCKLVMAANKFPRITDHSSAFYKRLILLPCDRVFEAHEQDINLKNKLKEELPGIFNWAVKGFHRLEERGGFEVSKKFMTDAIEELREESNPVDVFFRENIVTDVMGTAEIEKGELYIKYAEWCRTNGNVPMANNKFSGVMYAKYSKFTPKDVKSNTGNYKRVWKNIRFINHNIPQGEQISWQNQESTR